MASEISKLNKKTRAKNAAFRKMTPAQKRVCMGKLKPTGGTYLHMETGMKLGAEDMRKDLSDILPLVERCDVCAICAIFTCAVLRNDSLQVHRGVRLRPFGVETMFVGNLDFNEHAYVSRFFGDNQRKAIERAFESWALSRGDGSYVPISDRIVSYRKRMELIMQNIIEYDGTFEPEKLRGQLTAPSRR